MQKNIEQFMWAFQPHFRRSVEFTVAQGLKALDVETTESVAFLVGTLADGDSDHHHPICIEPEDGPLVPADFDGVGNRAATLYRESPESRMRFSNARLDILKHREFRDRAHASAIEEVLNAKLPQRFFVSLPTLVGRYRVFTAIGLAARILETTPQLVHDRVDDRYPVTRSLVHGLVEEILKECARTLYLPDPTGLGIATADLTKSAGRAFTHSAESLTGAITGGQLFDALNRLATTPYERRVGVGSLLLAKEKCEHIVATLRLQKSVHVGATRSLRKLLETSSRTGESLLTDGERVYGLGHRKPEYPEPSESVFEVVVTGNGVWELTHGETRLALVEFGEPRLPQQQLKPERLDDVCGRLFGHCDSAALWELAETASEAEHGTMLVISDDAAGEAERLGSQAFRVKPQRLDSALVRQVIGIDGAVLVDAVGRCHAIGVILDGVATAQGDRSRGSRFNSAVRYLATIKNDGRRAVVLIVSEDGMINLLPDISPRIQRKERDALVAELREAAALDPVNAERFFKAYRRVEAKAFYLSAEQVDEVNALMGDHWERRMAEGAGIRVTERPLTVNADMNDEYLID
ncbi:hypothetical protein GAN17_00420 [Mycobacterium kubicae]|uniref:DNA integrity scanning protein DisA nucleotide-binding domain protein n=1 Tax=Mycobacterium kubicae TaxID=120959 RepID=UPI0016404454|nr:DNA integrity scanning protein DisA nucleotide-binding domain protein [Mycobacterium kubicae]QNI04947.1 hypothetical protein GAN17_00420 [Mycobacterium kubicae]